jgi:LysR family transcriptional regulator, low CO2-responsive transcriptional regulator
MRYTFTQLRAFDAVAREGSFKKAATRLRLTQPAVSLQVSMLEEAYKVSLFERTKQGVTLTEIGRSLFQLSRQMPGIDEQVHELLSSARELKTGQLRLAAGSPYMAMDLIARFARRYPQVKVSVSLGNAEEVWQRLLEHRVDAVIVTDVSARAPVIKVPVARKVIAVVVPKAHPLASRSTVDLESLEGELAIFRDEDSLTQQIVSRALAKAGVSIRPVLQLGTREAVREAIGAGLGIGFLFDSEVGRDDRLRAIRLNGFDREIYTVTACLESQGRRQAVKAFLDIAREVGAAHEVTTSTAAASTRATRSRLISSASKHR